MADLPCSRPGGHWVCMVTAVFRRYSCFTCGLFFCRHSGAGVGEVFPSVVILQTMVVSPLVLLYPIYVRFEKNEVISGILGQWGWRVLFLAGIGLVFWLPTTRYFAPLLKPGDKTLFIMIPVLVAFPFVLSHIIMTIAVFAV